MESWATFDVAKGPKRRGHTVHLFNRGTSALDALLESRPDLVITDYNMPEIDGIEVLKRVMDLVPGAGRILMSGCVMEGPISNAVSAGLIHVGVQKPLTRELLKQAIDAYFFGEAGVVIGE